MMSDKQTLKLAGLIGLPPVAEDWKQCATQLQTAIENYARLAPLDLLKLSEIQQDLLAIANGDDPPSQLTARHGWLKKSGVI